MSLLDRSFACMGSDIRLLFEVHGARVAALADDAEAYAGDFARRLTRFDPATELSRLNAEPRPEVPVSSLLATAVRAGVWAAERTGGLVDPTLVEALEAAGYSASRAGVARASLSAGGCGAGPMAASRTTCSTRPPASPHGPASSA
jgi:FAD:protein FMN transferase